jgi:acyl carrier protein
MDIRTCVTQTFEEVASEHKKELEPLIDELNLIDSGIDSLCLAIIVARLEDKVGVDPFETDEEIELPITFGDFVRVYENAIANRSFA